MFRSVVWRIGHAFYWYLNTFTTAGYRLFVNLNIGGGAGGTGGGAVVPSNENLRGHSLPPPLRFGAEVRHTTNIRTICEVFNKTPVTKTLLGEVHKLLRLYLTLPVASATSECTFFCPQSTQELPKKHHEARSSEQVPTYALSQIDYGHTLDTFEIAKRCACAKELRKGHFGIFE